jgi:hypothetical protein
MRAGLDHAAEVVEPADELLEVWISAFFNPELPFINVEKGRLPFSTFRKLKKGKM